MNIQYNKTERAVRIQSSCSFVFTFPRQNTESHVILLIINLNGGLSVIKDLLIAEKKQYKVCLILKINQST